MSCYTSFVPLAGASIAFRRHALRMVLVVTVLLSGSFAAGVWCNPCWQVGRYNKVTSWLLVRLPPESFTVMAELGSNLPLWLYPVISAYPCRHPRSLESSWARSREDLPIDIVPTVGTAPTKLVFALLTWTEQIRISLDHHSVTATARDALFHHGSSPPPWLVVCKRSVFNPL